MENIIGIDAHSDFCHIVVCNKGLTVLKNFHIDTSQEKLITFIESIPKTKVIVFEESNLSSWLKRTLLPYVNKIVVADPKENAWITKADVKNDKMDAYKLAKLYNAGLIKEVYHTTDDQKISFKELIMHYHDITQQIVAFKNKMKDEFRQKLIKCKGSSVYNQENKKEWLAKLPNAVSVFQVTNYYNILSTLLKSKKSIVRKMMQISKHYPEINKFQDIPGIGLSAACTIFAIIDTPYRFSKKSKLWTYAHLGKGQSQSAYTDRTKSSNNGNRLLKYVLMTAVQHAIRTKNKFSDKYYSLVLKNVSSGMAKRVVARNILTTIWSIWKSGQTFEIPDINYNENNLNIAKVPTGL